MMEPSRASCNPLLKLADEQSGDDERDSAGRAVESEERSAEVRAPVSRKSSRHDSVGDEEGPRNCGQR